MHAPHLTPLNPPLAINYRNHGKNLVCFSHLAVGTISFFFFFTKRPSQKGGGGGHGTMPPLLSMLLPRSLRLGACERIISLFKGS